MRQTTSLWWRSHVFIGKVKSEIEEFKWNFLIQQVKWNSIPSSHVCKLENWFKIIFFIFFSLSSTPPSSKHFSPLRCISAQHHLWILIKTIKRVYLRTISRFLSSPRPWLFRSFFVYCEIKIREEKTQFLCRLTYISKEITISNYSRAREHK